MTITILPSGVIANHEDGAACLYRAGEPSVRLTAADFAALAVAAAPVSDDIAQLVDDLIDAVESVALERGLHGGRVEPSPGKVERQNLARTSLLAALARLQPAPVVARYVVARGREAIGRWAIGAWSNEQGAQDHARRGGCDFGNGWRVADGTVREDLWFVIDTREAAPVVAGERAAWQPADALLGHTTLAIRGHCQPVDYSGPRAYRVMLRCDPLADVHAPTEADAQRCADDAIEALARAALAAIGR